MATSNDISFYIAEDVQIVGTCNKPTSIAGWSMTFTIKATYAASTALVTKGVGSGIALTDTVLGVFTVTVLSGDTSGLASGAYVYDVTRVTGSNRTVLTVGALNLLAKATL